MKAFHPPGVILWLLASLLLVGACNSGQDSGPAISRIVIIAGSKSHPPHLHEYLKSARLLKAMIERAENLKGVAVEISEGWPEDVFLLQSADLLVTLSDGPDGPNGSPTPFMASDRMASIQHLIDRGCGFLTFHFSTFAPDSIAQQVLDWSGGYFDWQNDAGEREWYSAIDFADTTVVVEATGHPVARGLPASFRLHDEYYYNMRFREADTKLEPILSVPALGSEQSRGNVVAWALERANGGRGFGTTIGHFYSNWENPTYRKFILNALVWTAGGDVPKGGVDAPYLSDSEVTEYLFGAKEKVLIVTGHHHPGHDWGATTPIIRNAIEADPLLHVDVTTSIQDLSEMHLGDYGALVLNYCNWELPDALSEQAKSALTSFVSEGGGLIVLHFSNGAFHFSLPGAEASDWPEYRQLVRRVWDHSSDSGHDAYGTFLVQPTEVDHPITAGMEPFETVDELYYNQKGSLPIEPLLTAYSKDTGRDEPQAFAYQYGDGRVFQTLLGHGPESLEILPVREMLRRSALWVVGL